MPQHEPLTEDEELAWRAFHQMTTKLNGSVARELMRETGLSEADYEVLHALHEAPDHTLRSLALRNAVHWEKSRLSHQVARMERRGLVTRSVCEDDSRSAIVTLTKTGQEAVGNACCEHAKAVRAQLLDALTPDQRKALMEISETVLAHIDHEASVRSH